MAKEKKSRERKEKLLEKKFDEAISSGEDSIEESV
jgi:hypothetical protein